MIRFSRVVRAAVPCLAQQALLKLLLPFFSLLLFCSAASAVDSNILNLGLNEATPLLYKTTVDTVFISNPQVADYQILDGKKLIVYGKTVGSTTLMVMNSQGDIVDTRTLVVNKSLAHIRQQVAARFPEQVIEITNLGDQVILEGTVPSEEVRQNIYYLVGELLGKDYEDYKINWSAGDQDLEIDFMTRRRFHGLVNNLQVSDVKQVNVKLTIAEVSQSFVRQLGVQWAGVGPESILGNGHFLNAPLDSLSSQNIARFITAADDDDMAQILAEPNLSVISGETASFLAGGELPIVTYLDDKFSVEYKEFGVRLELAAKVLSDNKIKLSMVPEVSALDQVYGDDQLNIPAFKTRRARTTVQLADGESFVLGGLLNAEEREALSKIPLVGDLPVIGSLFRYTEKERIKTELVIVATVNLVRPVPAGSVQIPRIKVQNSLLRFFRLDLPGHDPVERYQAWLQKKKAEQVMLSGGFME